VGEGQQKVVIDTNVFISAFGWGGIPFKIIQMLERGVIRNCTSEEILSELTKSIAYPKPRFSRSPDPDDNKFIEYAITANAKIVISGDKGLLSLK